MAGRPLTRAQARALDEIGEEALLELVEDGMTVRELLRLFGVGNRGFYMWLDQEPGRRQRFTEARAVYAEALDKEGMEIVDGCPPDKEHIALAKLRVEQRRHVAANADKTRQAGAAGTVVNIGTLHLEAVRERMGAPMLPATTEEAEWHEVPTEDLGEDGPDGD